MGLEVERGNDKVDVDEGLGKLEVGGHGCDSRSEVHTPLTPNVVGGDECEEGNTDDTGKENIIHVCVAGGRMYESEHDRANFD